MKARDMGMLRVFHSEKNVSACPRSVTDCFSLSVLIYIHILSRLERLIFAINYCLDLLTDISGQILHSNRQRWKVTHSLHEIDLHVYNLLDTSLFEVTFQTSNDRSF